MIPVYLNDWKDGGFDAMVSDFEGVYSWQDEKTLEEVKQNTRWQGLEILLASYGTEDFGGDAFVLFRRDGKLYEVNGGHCSCYGLGSQGYSGDTETQWEPEETTIEALQKRMDDGCLGSDGYNGNKFADELREVLAHLRTT